MNRLLKTLLVCLCLSCWNAGLQAQNYEALDSFMRKYCQNWRPGYAYEAKDGSIAQKVQLGTSMPEFHFNDTLNSQSLRRRYVLLNYWATWCVGCRWLSVELDTVMFVRHTPDPEVQVIGVDAHERLADKGFHAEAWWKEKGIHYSSVGGKQADACCDTVHGSHPSAILIDPDGIIRGRWDAWSPGLADFIRFAIWTLKDLPRENLSVDLATARRLFDAGEQIKALYVLEQLPKSAQADALKYECLLSVSSYDAGQLADTFSAYKEDDCYPTLMQTIVNGVSNTTTSDLRLLRQAVEAGNYLLNHRSKQDKDLYHTVGKLYTRYGEVYIQRGSEMTKKN